MAAQPNLVWLSVTVTWTDDGAAQGAEGGIYDHSLNLETVRFR